MTPWDPGEQRPPAGRTVSLAVALILALAAGVAGSAATLAWQGVVGGRPAPWSAPAPGIDPGGAAGQVPPAGSGGDAGAAGAADAAGAGLGAVAEVYRRVAPAVVGITIRQGGLSGAAGGSGFVIDPRGHILTNYHVVADAEVIRISLADGTELEGGLLGSDPANDLAVVAVDPGDRRLPTVTLGDSDTIEVGAVAIAVGNPYGLERTVTAGIISGRGRVLYPDAGRAIRNLIQTDAAINPGNSGGPLLNLRGEVIGINTAKERGDGIGFAVPINVARRWLPTMIAGERVEHPWLGISGYEITPEMAAGGDLPVRQGVVVSQVLPHSPAARAGLRGADAVGRRNWQRGVDIIVAVDGRPVDRVTAISDILDDFRPGDTVTVRVHRDGAEVDIDVTLAAWPESMGP